MGKISTQNYTFIYFNNDFLYQGSFVYKYRNFRRMCEKTQIWKKYIYIIRVLLIYTLILYVQIQ